MILDMPQWQFIHLYTKLGGQPFGGSEDGGGWAEEWQVPDISRSKEVMLRLKEKEATGLLT